MPCITKTQFSAPCATMQFPLGDNYVNLRELNAKQLRQLQDEVPKDKMDSIAFTCMVLAMSCCDDDGKLLFADGKECEANLDLPFKIILKMADAVIKFSSLDTPPKN